MDRYQGGNGALAAGDDGDDGDDEDAGDAASASASPPSLSATTPPRPWLGCVASPLAARMCWTLRAVCCACMIVRACMTLLCARECVCVCVCVVALDPEWVLRQRSKSPPT
jgi:hypothetical protein